MDELDYQTWQASPQLLDQELCRMNIHGIGEFFTFKKYESIQETFDTYRQRLSLMPGFAIEPKDVVVDIGAHHGIVALNFASQGARVIAYEPHPLNFEILKRNAFAHKEWGIVLEPRAAFGVTEELQFDFGKTLTTGALEEVGRDWKRTGQRISVNADSFKDVFQKHDLAEVKLMKVDCEGAEYDFIMKAPDEYLRKVLFFFFEAHPTKMFEPKQLSQYMQDKGFQVESYPVHHGCFDVVCRRI